MYNFKNKTIKKMYIFMLSILGAKGQGFTPILVRNSAEGGVFFFKTINRVRILCIILKIRP